MRLPDSTAHVGILGLLLMISLMCCSSCKSDPPTNSDKDFDLKVRLAFEPDRLNPMLSTLTQATQIERRFFLPLADFNPTTLELEPMLLTAPPIITTITDGPWIGGTSYDMEILPQATWDDGNPVTGYDYDFTMKAAQNPYLSNLAWQSHMDHIVEIIVDTLNPKRLTVIANTEYILSEAVITTNPIYPAHIYDQKNFLKPFSFQQIKDHRAGKSTLDQVLQDFATEFNSDIYSRKIVTGAGPYEFIEWIPNQQIVARRKNGWWGNQLNRTHPLLQAIPTTITYLFIPDAQTAMTALKDGKIDVLAELSPEQFTELEAYNKTSKTLVLKTAPILQYYFIAYNNDHPILQDRAVRKAMTHLMDIETLVAKLFFGLAVPTVGPILPALPAYDHSLKSLAFQPKESARLLKQADWIDSDNNHILDKVINGQFTELRLSVLTTRSQLSQDVAVLIKEQAEKLGIQMEIIPYDIRNLLEVVRKGDYALACLASSMQVGPYDPYNAWHSDNAKGNGNNLCKFRNAEADVVIEKLRRTLDPDERDSLYRLFQNIIYREQPALFLVSPKFCMATGSNINFNPTAMRPGYFENTFSIN